jgi:hypothetical protein
MTWTDWFVLALVYVEAANSHETTTVLFMPLESTAGYRVIFTSGRAFSKSCTPLSVTGVLLTLSCFSSLLHKCQVPYRLFAPGFMPSSNVLEATDPSP